MKRKSMILTVCTLVLLVFSTTSTAFAAGWLSPEWYQQYYSSQQNTNAEPATSPQPEADPQTAEPNPTPAPKPAPAPEPTPQPEPVKPATRTGYGWLSSNWYNNYYGNQPTTPEPTPAQKPATGQAADNTSQPNQAPNGLIAEEQRMLDLINAERAKAGISAVKLDMSVTNVARLKSQDMVDNGYFAHQSPTHGNVNDMLDDAGVNYKYAGEILAKTSTPERALALFMGSSIHRANILSSGYTHAGVGIVRNGSGIMVTVMFVKR